MTVVVIQSTMLLGLLGAVYIARQCVAATTKSAERLEGICRNLSEGLELLGAALSVKIDSLERSSQAHFQGIDKRLGRQGRRIEATYTGLVRNFGPLDLTTNVVPLAERMDTTNEALGRTNVKLDKLWSEVEQSSKRLREQSAQLRNILEEQSKVSSSKVLAAKALVIEEILEGIDSLVVQGKKKDLL